MERVNVGDRVQIIKAGPNEQHLLNKSGTLMLISDDVNGVVALDDGTGATVTIDRLKKLR